MSARGIAKIRVAQMSAIRRGPKIRARRRGMLEKFQLVLAATGNGTASCRRRTAASNVHSPASGPPQIEPAVVGSSRPEVSRRRALPREEPTSAGRGDRAR